VKKKKVAFIDRCLKCGSSVRTLWTPGRKLERVCNAYACEWRSEPYTPPKQPIRTVKSVDAGGWEYEMFDQYGHTAVMSQSYGSRAACVAAALKDIKQTSAPRKDGTPSPYGECSAVVWPPTVQVKGTLVKLQRKRR